MLRDIAKSEDDDEEGKKPFVTFVVPTVGRPTLPRALESIARARRFGTGVEALVGFDGVDRERAARLLEEATGTGRDDDDASWIRAVLFPSRLGRRNHAGETRNRIVQALKPRSNVIAFLDDDDTIDPRYARWIEEEVRAHPSAAAVVFRMRPPNGPVIPPPSYGNAEAAASAILCRNKVGISFAVNTDVAPGFRFEPGPTEDFEALRAIHLAGREIRLSPLVAYYVRRAAAAAAVADRPTDDPDSEPVSTSSSNPSHSSSPAVARSVAVSDVVA